MHSGLELGVFGMNVFRSVSSAMGHQILISLRLA